jgi:small nuclear ribonucleoprotein (snRNP)-like protein
MNKRKHIFVKIMLDDYIIIKGEFVGLDKHLNIVINKGKEYRLKMPKNVWEERNLGFIFIRGDSVISISFSP